MKKLLTAAIAAGMMMTATTALASLPSEEIAIGGIAPGATVEEAKTAFGAPVFEKKNGMTFGNGVVIDTKKKAPGIVHEIEADEHCAAATPAGVKVGMSADVLSEKYGEADRVEIEFGDTEYKYYSHDGQLKMEFEVENGIITKIECEIRD
ncbi:MAG: hypothetical protein IJS96_02825 [Schwartzia sp.]|nr:hypothetical protein [Schwartzia sp. (in: firmicutes)]